MALGAAIKQAVSWCAPWAVVVRGPAGPARRVALTFDDGPHPENTPRILDTLDAHGAHATFFVQGNMAHRHPELVRDIAHRGHQVGNHGYAHRDARTLESGAYIADVLRAQATIEDILGQAAPRFFRPPYGNVTLRSTLGLLRRRFRFIFWSLDSRDSFIEDAGSLVTHLERQPLEAGCIMLLHDDYRHTTEALQDLIALLRRQNLTSVALSDLLPGSRPGQPGESTAPS